MAKTATKPSSTSAKAEKPALNGHATNGSATKTERLPVMKTYKIFIGGKFPRTESGRYYQPMGTDGKPLANVCRSSRKDVRDAVVAARSAFSGWSGRSAFNRGQILYRIGEMLEGRRAQFVHELMLHGSTERMANDEVSAAIDRWIHYAGWCDKVQAVFSSVNPTNSSHFNFSVYEPMGVVGVVAPEGSALLGLVSMIAPVIAGGNTCVVVASESMPLPARHLHRSAGNERPARRRGEPAHGLPQRTAQAARGAHGHQRRGRGWRLEGREDHARSGSHVQPEAHGVPEGERLEQR
jgi:hypothetical protein